VEGRRARVAARGVKANWGFGFGLAANANVGLEVTDREGGRRSGGRPADLAIGSGLWLLSVAGTEGGGGAGRQDKAEGELGFHPILY
jgi:hypothetical protein